MLRVTPAWYIGKRDTLASQSPGRRLMQHRIGVLHRVSPLLAIAASHAETELSLALMTRGDEWNLT